MKVSLLEAPVCAGSPTVGSQYAFGHLIKNGFADISAGQGSFRWKNRSRGGIPENPRMKGAAEVMAVSRVLYENVVRELAGGYFPIVIGGDHSAAIGSVSGSAARDGAAVGGIHRRSHRYKYRDVKPQRVYSRDAACLGNGALL